MSSVITDASSQPFLFRGLLVGDVGLLRNNTRPLSSMALLLSRDEPELDFSAPAEVLREGALPRE